MSPDERAAMSPLEIVVWAQVYCKGPRVTLEEADEAVAIMRDQFAMERRILELNRNKSMHVLRLTLDKNANPVAVSCSCGYRPPEGKYDSDELMTLHMLFVRALGPEDPEPTPIANPVSPSK